MPELLQILGTIQILGVDIPTTVAVVLGVLATALMLVGGKVILGWLHGVLVWLALRHTIPFLISSAGIGVGTLLELTQEAGLLGTVRQLLGGIPLVGDFLQGLLPATLQLLTFL